MEIPTETVLHLAKSVAKLRSAFSNDAPCVLPSGVEGQGASSRQSSCPAVIRK